MPVCDPFGQFVDYCTEHGGATTEKHGRCWTGFDEDAEFGDLSLYACSPGCQPCRDLPEEMMNQPAPEGGQRWLRPASPSDRDAFGMLHDLRSGHARKIGRRIVYKRAPTFQQTDDGVAIECFNRHPCRCWRPPLEETLTDACPGGEAVGEAIKSGCIPDNEFYDSLTWPTVGGNEIYCRRFNDTGPARIVIGPWEVDGMLLPILLRAERGCASNPFIVCLGRPHESSDCGGNWLTWYAIENPGTPLPDNWVLDEPTRQAFNYMLIRENAAHIDPPRNATRTQVAEIGVKNAAFERLKGGPFGGPAPGGVKFDRLDRINTIVWRRSWNDSPAPDCSLIDGTDTLLETWPSCRTRYGGDTVRVEVRVLWALMTCAVVGQMYHAGADNEGNVLHAIDYYVRCKIDVGLAYRGHGETVTVRHHDDCSLLPFVDRDRIDYVRNGVALVPPRRATWYGYYGRFGREPTHRNRYVFSAGTVPRHCVHVWTGFAGIRIPGHPVYDERLSEPTIPGELPPFRSPGHYGGHMRFDFGTSI